MKRHRWIEWISIFFSILLSLFLFCFLFVNLELGMVFSVLPTVLFYLGLTFLLRPEERIGKIRISTLPQGELLHEKLDEAGQDYARMKEVVGKIMDPELTKKCRELLNIAESVLRYLTENPEKISAARKYIDYYQETAANVLEQYVKLQNTQFGTQKARLLENTRETVQVLYQAFQIQFEKLTQNELIDMEADMNLLRQTLEEEGYGITDREK